MFNPENDADWDTLEANQSAAVAASGCCVICECPLDPTAAKWAGQFDTHRVRRNGETVTEPWSAEQERDYLGPVLDWAGDRHVRCYNDVCGE